MLHLLLVIHNHQPLGNLPDVFRKAYDVAYKPFLDVVRSHPGIKWALHCSGCLWEWLEAEEPGYLDALREEFAEGRLEFLTGGMWEPIQPLIHEASFHHQFEQMRSWLKERFGVEPIGSWTTERVWEPAMASRLSAAGVRYTLLDDSQLRAGLPEPGTHKVWGYYRTENNGRSVAIFPINEKLRYLVPFRPAEEAVGYLENLARELPDGAGITYGDDGEKFGLWPETYNWVYEKGWLDDFLGRIENSPLITTTHPAEYKKLMPHPRMRVYIPTSSYREMGIWNLYPNRNLVAEGIHNWVESNYELKKVEPPHVGGLFRTFLARYPESRYMHERVQEIIRRIAGRDPEVKPSNAPDASPLSKALWHALRAQCNCAYWHGIFGGLYLNYLRFAVHRELLMAERELEKADPPFPSIRFIGTSHVSADRGEEPDPECSVLVATEKTHWVIDPRTGQVVAAGSLDRQVDVIDVLARRFEAYHATMRESRGADDGGSPASIHDIQEFAPAGWREGHGYDRCRRGCFADRLLVSPPDLDRIARVEYSSEFGPETGYWLAETSPGDASPGDTLFSVRGKKVSPEMTVRLENAEGAWWREKVFVFNDGGRTCEMQYRLKSKDENPFDGVLLVEFNIGLLAGDAPDRYHLLPDGGKHRLSEKFELDGLSKSECVDEWSGVRVVIDVPGANRMGVYPVNTLCRGEGGLVMTYQGTCIVFMVPVEIAEGADIMLKARMHLGPI